MGGVDEWENECSVQNDVIRGDGGRRPLSKRKLTFSLKILTAGAVTTETGSLFQYFTESVFQYLQTRTEKDWYLG